MEKLIQQAGELGNAIRVHARFTRLRQVEEQLKGNEELQTLLQDYEKAIQSIRGKEQNGQPVEPDEKRALNALHERITSEALLQELAKAQSDYAEMMNAIQSAIQDAITDEDPPAE